MSQHLSDFDGQRLVMVGSAKATDGRDVLRTYVVDFGPGGANVAHYKVVPEEIDYAAFADTAGLGSPEEAAEHAANRVSIAASQAGYYGLVRELHGLFLSLGHGAAEAHPKSVFMRRFARAAQPFQGAVTVAGVWAGVEMTGGGPAWRLVVIVAIAAAISAAWRWFTDE